MILLPQSESGPGGALQGGGHAPFNGPTSMGRTMLRDGSSSWGQQSAVHILPGLGDGGSRNRTWCSGPGISAGCPPGWNPAAPGLLERAEVAVQQRGGASRRGHELGQPREPVAGTVRVLVLVLASPLPLTSFLPLSIPLFSQDFTRLGLSM